MYTSKPACPRPVAPRNMTHIPGPEGRPVTLLVACNVKKRPGKLPRR